MSPLEVKPTFWKVFLQHFFNIVWFRLSNCLELLLVLDCQMWSHVVCIVAQVDLQVLVPEDALFVTENGVGELRMELGDDGCWSRRRRSDHRNDDRIIGIGRPWDVTVSYVR